MQQWGITVLPRLHHRPSATPTIPLPVQRPNPHRRNLTKHQRCNEVEFGRNENQRRIDAVGRCCYNVRIVRS